MGSLVERKPILCIPVIFNWSTKWQQACAWQSNPVWQPKAELPLSSASLLFQVQCLSKSVKLFQVAKLKNTKLTTRVETKETIRGKMHLFHLLCFTCNLCKKSLLPPACMRRSTLPKVAAAAQVYRSSHKCHCPREHTAVQKDWSPEESSFAREKNTGKSQWIEKWQRRCETNSKEKQMEAVKWSRRVQLLPSRLHKREKRREKTQVDGLGYELIKKVSHSKVVNWNIKASLKKLYSSLPLFLLLKKPQK